MTKTEKILRNNIDGEGIGKRVYISDRAHADVKGKSVFTPRERSYNEATPRTINIWTSETYKGDELRPYDGRTGAMDFKKLPSKGLG